MAITVSIVCAVLMGAITFRLFFRSFEDFLECFFYALKPDILSWVDGTISDDFFKSLKLSAWLIVTIGTGGLLYWLLH